MNTNSSYMGMWHITKKLTMLTELFLYEIISSGGGQGDTHMICSLGKSMTPTIRYLGWEGGLDGYLLRGIPGFDTAAR